LPIQLDTCQIRKPRHVRKLSSVADESRRNFICSKLGQNLSEMEVGTFLRIQRVIWDHLLVFEAEIIQKQALFQFLVLNNSRRIIMSSSQLCSLLCFSFVLVSSPPRLFFRLNQVKKVRKRCCHSRLSFQAIILGFFDPIFGLCCSCFSVAIGDRGYFL